MFAELDLDGSKTVSKVEFWQLLRALDLHYRYIFIYEILWQYKINIQ
jgi:hypothetical protein